MRIDKEIKQSKFANDFQRLMVNILFTGNWINGMSAKGLKPYGLSGQQYNVLRILRGQHPNSISVNDIMSRMLDKMSNASRLVEKLRQKELLERTTCEHDRRQVDVRITDKGLALLKEIDDEGMNQLDYIRDNITEEEARLVSDLLDKLRG